jgi:hypothetical protein
VDEEEVTPTDIPESRGEDNILVFCPRCNVQVLANVVATHTRVTPVNTVFLQPPEDTHVIIVDHKFSVCPRCESPFLTKAETYEIPAEATVPQGETLLYPVQRSFNPEGVPAAVARAYESARRSFRVGLYDPCVIMCRKCLEAVCRELGAKRGGLKQKLDALASEGKIDQKLASWATGLRIVGNEAAHDVDAEIAPEDARDVIEFTEALLSYAFSLNRRFEEFRLRRAARDSKS